MTLVAAVAAGKNNHQRVTRKRGTMGSSSLPTAAATFLIGWSVLVRGFSPTPPTTTTTTTTTITTNCHKNPALSIHRLYQRPAFVVARLLPSSSYYSFSSSSSSSVMSTLYMSSFTSDGAEYSSKDSDYDNDSGDDDGYTGPSDYRGYVDDDESTMADVEPVEMKPVPMSKNSGNRFVALYWDHELVGEAKEGKGKDIEGEDIEGIIDPWALHYARNQVNEDHVMFCRKRNLYNETFNTDSMVDILKSLPILASDLQRVVGHALIMESSDIRYVHELLREDPILNTIAGGDHGDDNENNSFADRIPLYRWRHIRDHTLRMDDGRFGYPCLMIGLDDEPEVVGNARPETEKETLEYLIRSEKVIAAGPLHLPTQIKDDPSSIAVGDLILFNAKDRHDAVHFAEQMPSAMAGLYKDLRVHFYNTLDVTGKFVSEDPLRDAPGHQMKEAMEYWGYPVDDDQTPWLNC